MSKQSDLINLTDAITVDGSNNVGIGTTSPSLPLEVYHATNSRILASTGNTGASQFCFGDDADDYVGRIYYDHGNNSMRFHANTSECMRIDSSGGVAVANTRPTTDFDVGGRNMVIGSGSSDQGITIYSSSAGAGNIWFADGGGSTEEIVGGITYDHSGNFFKFRTNNTEAMRIDSGQQIFAGCTSTSGGVPNEDGVVIQGNGNVKFRVASVNNAANQYYSSSGSLVGSITVGSSSTSFNTSSDYRLKENLTPLDGAADRLAQIPVHRFNFIADPDTTVDGFLAHEVQAFVPEAITGEKDAVETVDVTDEDGNVTGTETRPVYQGIDQSKLVPLLTAALQEALQKIDALEARVAALETV